MTKRMQAKDIPEDLLIILILSLHMRDGYCFRQNLEPLLPMVPPKVLQAKLRKMIDRLTIDGCACGCSGIFRVISPEEKALIVETRERNERSSIIRQAEKLRNNNDF